MRDRKGLSQIISIVVIVVLVLVAIAIVWGIFGGMIKDKTNEASIISDCMAINLEIIQANCAGSTCNVTIKRNAGGDEIGGIMLLYTGESLNTETSEETGNINIPDTKTISDSLEMNETILEVEVIPYFINKAGERKLCPSGTEYKL